MVQERDEHVLGELEGVGKLPLDLPHAIYELKEDWRAVCVLVAVVPMPNSLWGKNEVML